MQQQKPGAITALDVMPLLLVACPSFTPKWVENLDESGEGGRLNYLDAGDFIGHLVSLKLEHRLEELPAVFDVIERLVLEGDGYVANLGVIGYIEGLQMMTVTTAGLDPERDFRHLLRPASERAWQELNEYWEVGKPSGDAPDGG